MIRRRTFPIGGSRQVVTVDLLSKRYGGRINKYYVLMITFSGAEESEHQPLQELPYLR